MIWKVSNQFSFDGKVSTLRLNPGVKYRLLSKLTNKILYGCLKGLARLKNFFWQFDMSSIDQ